MPDPDTGKTKMGDRFADLGRRGLATWRMRVERLPKPLLNYPEAELRMGLDYVLAERVAHTRDFFFVQIGAFDGRRYDPLFAWVQAHRWRGVLVEPQPRFFSELVESYKGVDGLQFRRIAVGVRNEIRPFYTVADGSGVPRDAGMIASLDRKTLLSHRRFVSDLDSHLRSEDIECVALNDLLAEVEADHIDLLQIDVEGYDHELVRVLDIERFAPSIVRFEHLHLTRNQYEASIDRLIAYGYKVCIEETDTLAYRTSDSVT
jgi:FkbM family methyltransferase